MEPQKENNFFVELFSAVKSRFGMQPKKDGKIYANEGQITMGMKGLSPGIELGIGEADPLVIYRPSISKRIPKSKAMDAYSGVMYSAIKVICDEVSQIKLRLFEVSEENDHEEKEEHDILDLLGAPNEFQTAMEFQWMLASHLKLTGNAYVLMRDNKGDPIKGSKTKPHSLFLLNPGNTRVQLNKIKYPYQIAFYEFTYEGKKMRYDVDSILHMREVDPNDVYDGIGAPQAIAASIDNDNFAVEYNRKFFINGAKIGGFLTSEMTTEPQLRALKTSFENSHTGIDKAHTVGILPKGVKFQPNTSSQNEMGFKGILEEFKDRILMSVRVSRTILGTAESDTNRATAETADYVFSKRTIKPFMEMICSFWNTKLVPRYGDRLYISFTDPTPEDKNFKIEELKTVIGSSPVLSVNEAREDYLGKGPIDNGDTVQKIGTLIELGAADDSADVNVNPDADGSPNSKQMKKMNHKFMMKGIVMPHIHPKRFSIEAKRTNDLIEDAVKAALKSVKKIKKIPLHEMSREEYKYIYDEMVTRSKAAEAELREKIIILNQKQVKEVDSRLVYAFKTYLPDGPSIDTKANIESMVFDKKSYVKATIDLATPILTDLAKKEGEIAAKAVGFPKIDVMAIDAYKTALDESIALMADSYQSTALDALKEQLSEGLSNGEGISKLAERISNIYDFQDNAGATRIAQTESMRTANSAAKAAWADTGVVKTMKWWTGQDDMVCEFCRTMNGKTISIDGNFFSKGSSLTGEDGGILDLSYGDVGNPPLHPNCRCYLQPDQVSIE